MTKAKIFNLIKEYLITIIVTVIFVFSLCLGVELELLFRSENKINKEEFAMENLAEFCSIDELEKKLLKNPTNYTAHIKLAQLYESLGEYKKAKEYYNNALNHSGRSNMSLYYFAMFCAKRNLYALASALCEEISGNSKKIIGYRARIYEAIGESLIRQKENQGAVKAFQIAYKYAKSIDDKTLLAAIEEKYADAYIQLADDHVKESDSRYAISNLENSIKIKKTPQAQYRLGLIYRDTDKAKAETYIASAFRINPFVVNPYIYNSLLNDLIKESKEMGDSNKANYYSMKAENLKHSLKEAYVYKNEILIDNTHIQLQKKRFSVNKDAYLVFDIKNNTKQKLECLYIKAEFFYDSKKYSLKKKAISKTNTLGVYDVFEQEKILLPEEITFENPALNTDIIVKYYVKKQSKAPWVLVKIDAPKF